MEREQDLNQDRKDVLAELINVGLGHACGKMGEMLGMVVQMEVPTVDLLPLGKVRARLVELDPGEILAVSMDITLGMDGRATMLFPPVSAATFVAVLSGDDPTTMSEEELLHQYAEDPDGALTEIGNIVINGVVGSVANGLHERVGFSVPDTTKETMAMLLERYSGDKEQRILFTIAGFSINEINITGNVSMLFHVDSVLPLMEALDRAMEELW
jgi:chemotaxis protein CheC